MVFVNIRSTVNVLRFPQIRTTYLNPTHLFRSWSKLHVDPRSVIVLTYKISLRAVHEQAVKHHKPSNRYTIQSAASTMDRYPNILPLTTPGPHPVTLPRWSAGVRVNNRFSYAHLTTRCVTVLLVNVFHHRSDHLYRHRCRQRTSFLSTALRILLTTDWVPGYERGGTLLIVSSASCIYVGHNMEDQNREAE